MTDRVTVRGESRSHHAALLERITAAWRTAFERSAAAVRNHEGVAGRVIFRARRDYDAFGLDRRSPVIAEATRAARELGLTPRLHRADGGLDANMLNAKGIPTVTLGAGQHAPHTVDEYVELGEFIDGCRLVLRLAVA